MRHVRVTVDIPRDDIPAATGEWQRMSITARAALTVHKALTTAGLHISSIGAIKVKEIDHA